jgi:hypothetical protein
MVCDIEGCLKFVAMQNDADITPLSPCKQRDLRNADQRGMQEQHAGNTIICVLSTA